MERSLDSWHSKSLGKEMPIARYGFEGHAFLIFPSAAADYLEYERFQLIDSIKNFLDEGRIQCFSINSINSESWLNDSIPSREKAIRHQQYNQYIANEIYPYIKEKIEDEKLYGNSARQVRYGIGIGHPNSGLNQAEFRNSALVEHCDLTIQDGLPGGQVMADDT